MGIANACVQKFASCGWNVTFTGINEYIGKNRKVKSARLQPKILNKDKNDL
ncbi:hypothetical protein [uncultured Helicobacter sp.]|uniref:hypothetical protein n=1 Tax=uncultured Helicobacter sp. TaxID=175537 RepID=UPI00261494EE|nr:hypothetical protein [uncultured Helicobacter sp.]